MSRVELLWEGDLCYTIKENGITWEIISTERDSLSNIEW